MENPNHYIAFNNPEGVLNLLINKYGVVVPENGEVTMDELIATVDVAFEIYDDSTLDWVVLLSNNIVNIQSEWPLTQVSFDTYLREKYGVGLNTEEEIYGKIYDTHHYETIEIKNSQGVVIIPGGLEVPQDYSVSYYDFFIESQINLSNVTTPVTNYEYEEKLEDAKRNIYVLKQRYLNIVLDDMEELMAYKEGATQYVSDTLKRADNIRLYS